MSIAISKTQCIGCGKCQIVCPGTLIFKDKAGKAYIKYEQDCWGCVSCVKECPVGAISFYLGEDMGGRGSTMIVQSEGPLLHWRITSPQGEETTITVDRRESNSY